MKKIHPVIVEFLKSFNTKTWNQTLVLSPVMSCETTFNCSIWTWKFNPRHHGVRLVMSDKHWNEARDDLFSLLQAQNSRQWTIRWNVFSGLFEVGDPHREISCHIKPLFRVCCWAAVRKWNVCVIMASHSIYITWSLCLLLFVPPQLIYCNHNEKYGAEYYKFWWK